MLKFAILPAAAAAALFVMGAGGAWAEVCEPSFDLKNNWTATTQESADLSTFRTASGNAFVTVVTYCVATNNGGNQVPAQGSEQIGPGEEIKVCQNVGNGPNTVTPAGEALGFTAADCNPL